MNLIKKILVPTDFSALSFAGIEYARSLGEQYGAEIHLVYVIESFSGRQTPYVDEFSETVLRDKDTEALRRLEEASRKFFSETKRVIHVILRGDPVEEIVRYARFRDCDLIVMATHGRTGVAHIMVGSVAEKIVRHSPVPVLTVKPEEMKNHFMEREDIDEQLHLPSPESKISK